MRWPADLVCPKTGLKYDWKVRIFLKSGAEWKSLAKNNGAEGGT